MRSHDWDVASAVFGVQGYATGAYIDLRGATTFGYAEFARRVAEAQAMNARRSGIRAIA